MSTRRQKQREQLISEIKATAREMMAEKGTASISIRAIANQIGVTPPAIHYYFKTVDDLITVLVVDSFNALVNFQADTIESNKDMPYGDQLSLFAEAYRQWALENPVDFQLIYGNPIPGYSQPVEITYPPARRGFALFAGLLAEAINAGALTPPEQYQTAAATLDGPLAALQTHEGHQHDSVVLYVTAVLWSRFYGLVMMELFNLIQPVVGDTATFYKNEIRHALLEFGVL